MTAVEFSPQERARLDAIEAAQPAPESLRERVRSASAEAVRDMPGDWWCPERHNVTRRDCEFCIAEVAADAALAVVKGDPS